MNDYIHQPPDHLFNTPVESGLRTLILLVDAAPKGCDLQRLVIYDYLLVHSKDIKGGPESIHPPSPFRSGELLVRRELLRKGLYLLQKSGLIAQSFSEDGITFRCTNLGPVFLQYLESDYATRSRAVAKWINDTFAGMSNDDLRTFADTNLGRWGAEFTDICEEDAE